MDLSLWVVAAAAPAPGNLELISLCADWFISAHFFCCLLLYLCILSLSWCPASWMLPSTAAATGAAAAAAAALR